MGCYSGVEVCGLAAGYILNKLKQVTTKENIGIFCNDGLELFQNIPKPETERKKKQIVKVFKTII